VLPGHGPVKEPPRTTWVRVPHPPGRAKPGIFLLIPAETPGELCSPARTRASGPTWFVASYEFLSEVAAVPAWAVALLHERGRSRLHLQFDFPDLRYQIVAAPAAVFLLLHQAEACPLVNMPGSWKLALRP
jgi:hypothetical protein